jgi:D-glycero-D-manno-heptose 1,7-bisphosphate phosphatase
MQKNKAIFLDRDGVMNEIVMRGKTISSPRSLEEFIIFPKIKTYLESFKKLGFLIIVFTNQPDVSRNLLEKEILEEMHEIIAETFPINDIVFCPHDNQDNCSCRKPKPGLIIDSAKKWSIDLTKSYVVGDSWKDVEAGNSAGCKTILLRKEYNKEFKKDYDFEIKSLEEVNKII